MSDMPRTDATMAAYREEMDIHRCNKCLNTFLLAQGGCPYCRTAAALAQRDKARDDALEQAAKVCDSDSGRHFLAIGIAQGEQAKHILGAKSACAMSLAAAIRAMKVEK
jgi:hypothetical protein